MAGVKNIWPRRCVAASIGIAIASAMAVAYEDPSAAAQSPTAPMITQYRKQWLANLDAAIDSYMERFRSLNQAAGRTRDRDVLAQMRTKAKNLMAERRDVERIRDDVAAMSDAQIAQAIEDAWSEEQELLRMEEADDRLAKLKSLDSAAALAASEMQKFDAIQSAELVVADGEIVRNGLRVKCRFTFVTRAGLLRRHEGWIEFRKTARYYWPSHANVDGAAVVFLDPSFNQFGTRRAEGLFETMYLGLPKRALILTLPNERYDDPDTYRPDTPKQEQ